MSWKRKYEYMIYTRRKHGGGRRRVINRLGKDHIIYSKIDS